MSNLQDFARAVQGKGTHTSLDPADIATAFKSAGITNPGQLLGAFAKGALTDTAGMVAGIPAAIGQIGSAGLSALGGNPQPLADTAVGMAKGLGTSFNDMLGKPINPDTMQYQGFSPGESLLNTTQHPVNTYMNLSLVNNLSGGRLLGGSPAVPTQAASDVPPDPTTIENEANPARKPFTQLDPATGRKMTALGIAPDPTSITRSENLMNKAMQMAPDATDPYDLARKLELKVPQLGNEITKTARAVDSAVGPIPYDGAIENIMTPVENSDLATTTADPALIQKVRAEVNNAIYSGSDTQSATNFTSVSDLNDARKMLNASIKDNWFKNGMPLDTPLNQLNGLRWEASNAIKNYMTSFKGTEDLTDLIDQQHTALSVSPSIAQSAFNTAGQLNPNPITNFPTSPGEALKQGVGALASKFFGDSPESRFAAAQAAANGVASNASSGMGSLAGKAASLFGKVGSVALPTIGGMHQAAQDLIQKAAPPAATNPSTDQAPPPPALGQAGFSIPKSLAEIQPDQTGHYQVPNPFTSGVALTPQSFTQQMSDLQSQAALPQNQVFPNNGRIQSQMDDLKTKYNTSQSLQQPYQTTLALTTLANDATDVLKSAPPNLFSLYPSYDKMRQAADPRYALLAQELQQLEKTVPGFSEGSLFNAQTPQVALSLLDNAQKSVLNNYYSALSGYMTPQDQGQSATAVQPRQSASSAINLPPIQGQQGAVQVTAPNPALQTTALPSF